MSDVRLSIMLPGLSGRAWIEMARELTDQAARFGDVEILVNVDGGVLTSGEKRQQLMDVARGDYVAFVDDDDQLSTDYLAALRRGCRSGRDVVTFRLAMTVDGVEKNVQAFTLGARDNSKRTDGLVSMAANHLCAWRRDIATRVAWDTRVGYADDQLWYKPLLALCREQLAECHVSKVLYRYIFTYSGTANQTSPRVRFAKGLYAGGMECWVAGNEILLGALGRDVLGEGGDVLVRDRQNCVRVMSRAELGDPYAVVKVV